MVVISVQGIREYLYLYDYCVIMKNKNGITPVIAISLLIVITVVGVLGFQTWFNFYSSKISSNVERESSSAEVGGLLKIEGIVDDSIYLLNSDLKNISLVSLKISGNNCTILEDNLVPGINKIDITSCLTGIYSGSINDIVVVTNKGISSKKMIINVGY